MSKKIRKKNKFSVTNTCTHSHAHRDRENKSDIKEVGGLSLVILTKKDVKKITKLRSAMEEISLQFQFCKYFIYMLCVKFSVLVFKNTKNFWRKITTVNENSVSLKMEIYRA